jgi:hypothetical protein
MTIYHKHHIIPKHMGGSDEPSNLIELTVEEHAEAHRKLYEEHGNEYDKIAWLSLTKQIDNAEARILSVIEWNKNRVISDETKEKLSNSMKDYFSDTKNRKKTSEATKAGMKVWWENLSEEERQDWIERCKKRPDGWTPPSGWILSDETRNKMKGPRDPYGPQSIEHKNNISKNRKGKGTGEENAMSKEENRKKVAQSKIGRKRVYQPDGSFKYLFPNEIGG